MAHSAALRQGTSGARRGVPTRTTAVRPVGVAAGAGPGGNRTQFLVVAMHKVRDRSAGVPMRWLPYGAEHAWEPGSRLTLCGQWMGDWPVFWERSFVVTSSEACPDCVEATLPPDSRSRLDPRQSSTRPA